jgi:neutral ceramidase
MLLAVAVAASGCVSINGARSTGAAPAPKNEFRAGVAKVDITPLPGYPMGGHSIAATVSRGVWTRLHASAIYLEDADGHPLVLVSCDLWSMPAGLADRVADLVAQDPAGKGIGRQAMIFAATHTHQSPGNFSSSLAYNSLASPLPGFDQQLFDYLARRMTTAVLGAVSNAQPARVILTQSSLPSAARNRSMPAFLLDPECKAILAENAAIPLADPWKEYPDPRASRAVDPRLRVLRIEGQQGMIALVGFLAIHPTALGHETEVYSADIFGIAETLAEQSLVAKGGANPCVVLFNGAEGDVSPMWREQDRASAWKVGSLIGAGLVACASGGQEVQGNIRSVFGLTSMAGHEFVDDASRPRQTAAFAEGGAALVAGAEDGRTIFNYDGHREGTRSTEDRRIGQGAKLDLLAAGLPVNLPTWVKSLPAKLLHVPQTVPLGVAQMGPIVFATLPGEFTTVMGRRIEAGLKADNPDAKEVILVGLANEYLSYFATPEEYDSQQYEGASTLYGPASGPLIQSELDRLARECASGTNETFPLRYHYSPGITASFLPPEKLSSLYNADDGLSYILQDVQDGMPYRRFPSISWTDAVVPLVSKMKAAELPVPRVWVEVRGADGSWGMLKINGSEEANDGLDFVTATSVARPTELTWTAFWMPPRGTDKSAAYRLCVTRADGTTFRQQFGIPADCPLGP